MTEREKLRTFGGYYLGIVHNYDKAIETYQELVAKYPAIPPDTTTLPSPSSVSLILRKRWNTAARPSRSIRRRTSRSNYALYAMYAGDFPTASSTAGTLIKEEPEVDTAYLPMAMAAIATGDTTRGRAAYQQAVSAGDPGVSLAAIGLADVAMYEGRYGEVIDALSAALERDAAQGNTVGEVAEAGGARGGLCSAGAG